MPLPPMIDLHSHVLPGIDDGPADIADSVEFAIAAARQGTSVLAATPHVRHDFPLVDVEQLGVACAELNDQLPADLDLVVSPGAEVDLLWAQDASDEELRLASLGQHGSDLLVETPYGLIPDNFEDLLFRVSVRGYRILLAHPERNPTFHRDPARLKQIAQRGVLIQITLPSVLARDRGSRSRKLAFALVREGLAHNLASDSHSSGRWRPPALRAAVDEFADHAPAYAEWMVTDAAAAILEGEPLPRPPRGEAPRRRGLRLPGRKR
jgi:protein-tyrosine phosphatase